MLNSKAEQAFELVEKVKQHREALAAAEAALNRLIGGMPSGKTETNSENNAGESNGYQPRPGSLPFKIEAYFTGEPRKPKSVADLAADLGLEKTAVRTAANRLVEHDRLLRKKGKYHLKEGGGRA